MAWYIDSNGLSTTSHTLESGPPIPVTEIFQLLVLLMWTCLNLTTRGKNPIFDKVFPSTSILAGLISSCSMVCCPGLFDILQAPTAPTLSQLKSFPTDYHKRWAIYLLVLEKPSRSPRVYIGSRTQKEYGVQSRMHQYTNHTHLPRYVAAALNEGYTITHKGLLLWAPIPSAGDVPILRAMFLLLEAALTFVFWAAKSKTQGGFGLRSLCPWTVDDLPYIGLCSHNPLLEGMHGDFALSPEELEDLEKTRKANLAAYHAEWYEKMKVIDPDARRAVNRDTSKARYDQNPDKYLAKNQKHFDKVIADKTFHCAPCGYSAAHQSNWDIHLKSARHLKKIAGRSSKLGIRRKDRASTIANKKYYCAPCDYSAVHQQNLDIHLKSKKHLKKVLLSSSGSSS